MLLFLEIVILRKFTLVKLRIKGHLMCKSTYLEYSEKNSCVYRQIMIEQKCPNDSSGRI